MIGSRFLASRLALLLLACPLAVPALAQPAPAPTQAPAAEGATQTLSLTAGTGILLRLPQPAATVLSADPTIARAQPASPTSLFLMGVAAGETTVIATNQAGAPIIQYNIRVTGGRQAAPASALSPAATAAEAGVTAATAAAVQAAIVGTVPGARQVRVHANGNGVVLTGLVSSPLAAEQAQAIARARVGEKAPVLNSMMVPGAAAQVNVRVRIAEINRQITRQLGFNWQALGSNKNFRLGLLTGAATAGAINPLLPLGLAPLASNPSPNQIGGGFTSGNFDVNGIVDALAADQLVTILAEPNLTAQSGETASFLAGGEFPVPVSGNSNNGTTTISVEFKQFGVSLAVVPTVLSSGRLNLRIRPEVSQLSTNGAVSLPVAGGVLTIPALTVRRAETTVELGSGQSFAIAGLLQRTSSDSTNALPGIGEVPVLGALFKSNDFQRGESELVIIVTPYIVQPAPSAAALRLPTDNFKPATDLDRILFGRQVAPAAGTPGLNAGFILK